MTSRRYFRYALAPMLSACGLLAGCAAPRWMPAPVAPAPSASLPGLVHGASAPVPSPAAHDLAGEQRYLKLAQAQLPQLYSYTGLSDEQLGRVREAERAIGSLQGRHAYFLTSTLLTELQNSVKHHRVERGESLWIISRREDVYDNPWLWPLIWDANRDVLPDPLRLRAGQTLKIRPNPTIGEVVKAVNFAHEHAGSRIRIGEVKEAGN